jgi:hypothetical protein
MRKLNVSTLVTLDGVIQDPGGFQELEEGGWGNCYFDDPESDAQGSSPRGRSESSSNGTRPRLSRTSAMRLTS